VCRVSTRTGGRFNREDGRPPREEREPSRADQVDDWGSTRTYVAGAGGGGGGGFGGSRGGFGDRDRGGGGGFGVRRGFEDRPPREARPPSAADQVDDWGSTRKFEPGPSGPRGGGGFDDRERRGPPGERRFDGPPPPSRADVEDSWGRGREFKPTDADTRGSRGFSGGRPGEPCRCWQAQRFALQMRLAVCIHGRRQRGRAR
jgi:hypothetical protein